MVAFLGPALMAGGTLAKGIGNSKTRGARGRRLDDHSNAQAALQAEAQAAFDQLLPKFTRDSVDRDVAGKKASRTTKLQRGLDGDVGIKIPLPGSAPASVAGEFSATNDRATDRSMDFARRLAELGAYRDSGFDRNIELNRGRQDIGRIANFASGQSRLLPFQLNEANQAGSTWAGFGDLLDQAGQMAFFSSLLKGAPGMSEADILKRDQSMSGLLVG